MNLVDIVMANADRRPDHKALEQGDRVVTYAALRDAVSLLARRLRAGGLAEGDKVGLAMTDTIDYALAMLALFRIGAVLLPVDVRWTATEQNHVLRAFGATAVIVGQPIAGLDAVRQIVPGELPPPATDAAWPHRADAPLLLSLSSGTTGTPKGPLLTHRQFMLRLAAEWITLGFASADRFLCATPFYFGGARGFTLAHLIGGATTVLFPPPYDVEALVAEIAARRISSLFLVPTILRRLTAVADRHQAALGGLRLLVSSGAALHPEERQAIRARITPGFYNLYASTEGGSISVLTPEVEGVAAASVGRPALLSRFDIVDDAGAPCAPGEAGHIRQSAPWLPDGFYENPEETAKYFRDGLYYPGDMGYADADGYLYITGRSKDMIIRGGVNIYPNEIERVLLTHPAVAEAAVVAWPSREFGEEVAAFVVLRAALDEPGLRAHCRQSLASYKVPRAVFAVTDIPKNSTGKVLKMRLSDQLVPL